MALRKNNLKIYGIAFSENETASQTEQKLRNYFSTELALNPDEPLLDYAYRLSNKKDSPILARFCALKSRDAVLNAFRHKRKQGHVTGRVVEDLPERIVKARTGLYPFLQQCIAENKSARFKLDKLIVDGDTYVFNVNTKMPILIPK